jgi:hypothetical protein
MPNTYQRRWDYKRDQEIAALDWSLELVERAVNSGNIPSIWNDNDRMRLETLMAMLKERRGY